MILVWNGWGILALLIALVGGLLGWALAGVVAPGRADSLAALGVALAGVAVVALGRRLNGPNEKRVAAFRSDREAELHHLVEHGGFMGLPGQGRPTSLEQARREAAELLDAETERVRAMTTNRHSIFFVPMQWAGVLEIVGGIGYAVVAAARG